MSDKVGKGIRNSEILANFSVTVCDDRTGELGFIKMEDFFRLAEDAGGEDE
jgi:hypothetical protein